MGESLNRGKFDKTLTLEEVQSIFERAKVAELKENGRFLDSKLNREVSAAITDVGKQKYYQLEKEIWSYLESKNENLLANAIRTLGFRSRLHVPEFRDVVYDIWNNYKERDEFSDVRRSALCAWCTYYELSNDKEALAILYKALTTHPVIDMRLEACIGIFTTCNAFKYYSEMCDIGELADKKSHEYVNQNVDWERVHKLMKEYAPDVELVDLSKLPKDS